MNSLSPRLSPISLLQPTIAVLSASLRSPLTFPSFLRTRIMGRSALMCDGVTLVRSEALTPLVRLGFSAKRLVLGVYVGSHLAI